MMIEEGYALPFPYGPSLLYVSLSNYLELPSFFPFPFYFLYSPVSNYMYNHAVAFWPITLYPRSHALARESNRARVSNVINEKTERPIPMLRFWPPTVSVHVGVRPRVEASPIEASCHEGCWTLGMSML